MSQSVEKILFVEIITFLEMKGRSTDELKDESWLQDLAFAVDITAHNLKLQSKNKMITALYNDVKCFFVKLKLWKSQITSENLVHFGTCKELQNRADTKSALGFAKYDTLGIIVKRVWEKI